MRFIHEGTTYEGVELLVYRTADLDLLEVMPRSGPRLFFIVTADAVRRVDAEKALNVAGAYGWNLAAEVGESASAA